MRLADLLSGGQVNNTGNQTQHVQTPRDSAQLSRMIRNLAPGQTLHGEVVGRNGSEVQIRLSDDMVLNARLDQNMNLEVGKSMTFEVRNNGQNLTLSPLFANTAVHANALKALEMASLPVNQDTVVMTGLMMEAGLSVNRNSLQQMFREINAFPEADISDIVDLHKLGIEVNEENLVQISSYKNLTHQLVDGMHTVLDSMPETLQNMIQDGNLEGAAKMFQELLQMIRELPAKEGEGQLPGNGMPVQEGTDGAPGTSGAAAGSIQNEQLAELNAKIETVNTEILMSMVDGKGGSDSGAENTDQMNVRPRVIITDNPSEAETGATNGNVAANGTANAADMGEPTLTQELLLLIRSGDGQAANYSELLQQLAVAEQNGDIAGQAKALQQLLQQGLQDRDQPLMEGMLSGKAAHRLLTEGMSRLWTIEPKQVADAGKVEELYQRLDRQLKSMTRMLEQGGQTDSHTYKAVTNMNQNLDFLHQLNQAYTYVQLPLRLQQGDAHGDLYVYTNKRNLAARDGQISALLHLDMEHLGPVDVYVAMQAENVNTRFYVRDDEMLDFLEVHMDLLTKRLQNRGYNCSFAMQVRDGQEKTESGLQGLMSERHAQPIAQYAFDVRV